MKINIQMTKDEWAAVLGLLYNVPLEQIEQAIPKQQWSACFEGIRKLRNAVPKFEGKDHG